MGRHSNYAMKKNAIKGAQSSWCPECHRKAALSAKGMGYRTCRYCGYVWKGLNGEHAKLYKAWEESQVKAKVDGK